MLAMLAKKCQKMPKNDGKIVVKVSYVMFENYTPLTLEELETSPGLHRILCVERGHKTPEEKRYNAKKYVLKVIKNMEFKDKLLVTKVCKYNYMCVKCNENIVKINNDWCKKAKQARLHSASILTCNNCKQYIKSKYLN